MLSLRSLAPKTSFWRDAQADAIRLCLIKVVGRVTEMVTRIRIALPSAFPYQAGFTCLPAALPSCRRERRGPTPQHKPLGATANPNHRVPDATKSRARSPPHSATARPHE
jgi:Transposase DDE domain group 1